MMLFYTFALSDNGLTRLLGCAVVRRLPALLVAGLPGVATPVPRLQRPAQLAHQTG